MKATFAAVCELRGRLRYKTEKPTLNRIRQTVNGNRWIVSYEYLQWRHYGGWHPGRQLRVSTLYFFLKNLATFFSRQFCGVTPVYFPLKNWRPFLLIAVTINVTFYCFHSGVTPSRVSLRTFFYLSDLVSPLFFVNLSTKFFSFGCHPSAGCHPGRSAPALPLVTPLKYLYFIRSNWKC